MNKFFICSYVINEEEFDLKAKKNEKDINSSSKTNKILYILIGIGIPVFIGALAFVIFYFYYRKKSRDNNTENNKKNKKNKNINEGSKTINIKLNKKEEIGGYSNEIKKENKGNEFLTVNINNCVINTCTSGGNVINTKNEDDSL